MGALIAMMHRGAGLLAALGLVLGFSAILPAGEPAPELDTTVVQGKSLKDLRKDVKKTEDRFRSLYNDLNEDSQQRITCKDDDAATGTRFKKKSCTTVAMHAATAVEMSDSLSTMQSNSALLQQADPIAPGAAGPLEGTAATSSAARAAVGQLPLKSATSLQAQRDAFQKNVEKLIAQHPELQLRYDEYVQARQRLAIAEGPSKPTGGETASK
jgi:hypothetical protein